MTIEQGAPLDLQLILLGVLMAAPDKLNGLSHRRFCNAEIAAIVEELQERAKNKNRGIPELREYLRRRGCDGMPESVEDAIKSLRERVNLDGEFYQTMQWLTDQVVECKRQMQERSDSKAAWVSRVKQGSGKEIQ